MMTRYSAWLDNIPMHDLDPSIYILDIKESAPSSSISTAQYRKPYGSIVLERRRDSLSVTISFEIHEYDPARRKDVMQKIHAWARNGGALSISDRPAQVLMVELDTPPVVESARKWTDSISITFTAYAFPYWMDAVPLVFDGDGKYFIPGTANVAPVNAEIVDCSEDLSVTVGDTTIVLNGLREGCTVKIGHDEDFHLVITEDDNSALAKRTAKSADDLIAVPGETVRFVTIGGSPTFSVRGVWT